MHPARDTLSNVPCSDYITARDQNMVESDVTEGGKNSARSCQFSFMNEHNTTQHNTHNTNTKPQAKKQRFFKLSQKLPQKNGS